jgi:hypothetical protein
MPSEKAPGPDGYTGLFYKMTWHIIKADVVQALHQIFNLKDNTWSLLNSANLLLLPKKEDTQCATDYKPINLMHSMEKILAKILANRLAPVGFSPTLKIDSGGAQHIGGGSPHPSG